MFAFIPSPPFNSIPIGPIDLRLYGLLIALGVIAGVWVAGRRLEQVGIDAAVVSDMMVWVLPAGVIGTRVYFVLTNWHRYTDDFGSAFRLWEGGLGIPGGVLVGVAVGVWWLRRHDVPIAPVFDAAALGIPTAQIIGRWGNWFNQELYGRPTDVAWALEIDPDHRLSGYEQFETFHPTFAYEIIWNIGLLGFLFWIDRKKILRPGALFAVYLIGYGIGRIMIETVRIDPVNEYFGIRAHIWAMILFIAAALFYLLRWGFKRGDDGETVESPGIPDDQTETDDTDDTDSDAELVDADSDAELADDAGAEPDSGAESEDDDEEHPLRSSDH